MIHPSPMWTHALPRLLDYHYWATHAQLSAVATLDREAFTRPVAGSYGSVRNTLVHVLSAERGWLDRCGGPPRGPALRADDFPDAATLRAAWTDAEAQLRAFVGSLGPDGASRVVRFTLGNAPEREATIGDLLAHGFLHAQHHRGQVALLLRTLGVPPGNTDFLFFALEGR